jgi:radical SAM superfamily enzyme YgiQ (UPF0313 family)
VGSLSAVLKRAGHCTSLLHLEKDVPSKWLLLQIERFKPDLIAMSTTTHQFPYIRKYAGWIKQHFTTPIVCGGIHPTLAPHEVIAEEGIDMVCVGEGEYPLLELVNGLEKGREISKVSNIWVKQEGKILQNPLRPLLQDLDELPFPDRDLFNFPQILRRWGGVADIMASRGCPHNCTYCCNHSLKKLYTGLGKFIRQRSVAQVIAEVQQIVSKYKVKMIDFSDDTFTANKNWLREFCWHYPREVGLPFTCTARVEDMTRAVLTELKGAGCERLNIGLESGNDWLRQEILQRKMTNEQIRTAFATAHELDLKTFTYNMIGLPFETPEMAEETIALNQEINPHRIGMSTFYPYPGTKLFQICLELGFLTSAHEDSYMEDGTVLNLPTLSNEQIVHYQRIRREFQLKKEIETRQPLRPFFTVLKAVLGERQALRLVNLIRRNFPNLTLLLRRLR